MKLQLSKNVKVSFNKYLFLILFSFISTSLEIFGVGIFIPIFEFMKMNGDISALTSQSSYWENFVNYFERFNISLTIQNLLILAFLLFFLRQIFVYIRLVYRSSVTHKLAKKLRQKLFNNYLSTDFKYYEKMPIGNFSNTLTTEVGAAALGATAPMEMLVYLITCFGYFVLLSFLSWEMTLFSLFVLLIVYISPKSILKKTKSVGQLVAKANTDISTFLISRLKSPRLIRLAKTENLEKKQFDFLVDQQTQRNIYNAILNSRTEIIVEPLVIIFSLIFIYIAYAFLNLTIETIGIYLVITVRLLPLVKAILKQKQNIKYLTGSINLIEEKFADMEKHKEQDVGYDDIQTFEKIEFKNVSFKYDTKKDSALNKINLKISSNKFITIVGPTGSGKSTLVDLIPRLKNISSGQIHINDKPIQNYTLHSLRRLISFAPQNPQLFNGTIKEHIQYGSFLSKDEEVNKCIKLCGLSDLVEKLPEKLNTIIGDDAMLLSGGQKRRIDLARAVISDSPILILDEPTSNLDFNSAKDFINSLLIIKKQTGKTIIIITHDLLSCRFSDEIAVLRDGSIESFGSYEEVLKTSKWFKNSIDKNG